eukprot:TRINITY_DN55785_c0_g1_i1.p1 TRINITY_DN55785_c0_g1~~TRINITY_DN55785_c0_g1_i1.p1  ORF type:complete len:561 (-),score=81.68 TRINITY_DN55785_c0_g1_i1:62-1744(-)
MGDVLEFASEVVRCCACSGRSAPLGTKRPLYSSAAVALTWLLTKASGIATIPGRSGEDGQPQSVLPLRLAPKHVDPLLAQFLANVQLDGLLSQLTDAGFGLRNLIQLGQTGRLEDVLNLGITPRLASRLMGAIHRGKEFFNLLWDGTWLEEGYVDAIHVDETVEIAAAEQVDFRVRLHKLPGSAHLDTYESMLAEKADANSEMLNTDGGEPRAQRVTWTRVRYPPEILARLRHYVPSLANLPVDEVAFDSSRLFWRSGTRKQPSPCRSKIHASLAPELRQLLQRPTDLIVNVGAGNGLGEDPLRDLLFGNSSSTGYTSRIGGVAIEENTQLHAQLLENLRAAPRVAAVRAKVTPANAWQLVREGLETPVAQPLLLHAVGNGHRRLSVDFLKVDIDSYDCVVAEALLDHVDPSYVFIEMNAAIPPPFQFVRLYRETWLYHPHNYSLHDHQRWSPSFGCSLSYIVRRFAKRRLWLMFMDGSDLVFASASLASRLRRELGLSLPYDEIACYREQRIWSPFPLSFIREWFFSTDVNESLSRVKKNLSHADEVFGDADGSWSLFL